MIVTSLAVAGCGLLLAMVIVNAAVATVVARRLIRGERNE